MNTGEPFTVQTGLELLDNMVITRLDTRKTPQNEDGLEFIAELRELIVVYTQLVKTTVESAAQLPEGDRAKTQAAPEQQQGQVSSTQATGSVYLERQKQLEALGVSSEILVTP